MISDMQMVEMWAAGPIDKALLANYSGLMIARH
jgi:hypothetical protein